MVLPLLFVVRRSLPSSLVDGAAPGCAVSLQRSSALCCIHLSSLRLLAVLVSTRPARFVKRHCAYHCLSLKAVLSSRLWDSTTVWSAEAFNTTGAVVVRGKTLVSHLSFSLALPARASPRMHLNSASSSSYLSCDAPIS